LRDSHDDVVIAVTLRATYRVQFHRDFTFDHARALVPYFARLGISHLYASPILMARAGSMHGYDVVDHARINPELGGEPAFRALVDALRANDIGVLLDIVPNHMAVGGADNPYWLDVLEKGRDSVFATMFDIDWDAGASASQDTLVLPVLGKTLAECLSENEITLVWDARLGKLAFAYGDNRLPLRLDDYPFVVGDASDGAAADLTRFADSESLLTLLSRQHFRLAHWRDAGDRINWRRFFDVTSLAAVRVEDDAVFEQTHATIFRLFSEGLIDGVRVDHVDGLADPAAYCRRLRARLDAMIPLRPESLPRDRALILVEKILAPQESLPTEWGVDGTTGYDFMNAVSELQHDANGEATFTKLWSELSGRTGDFEFEECHARRELLDGAFANALRATAAAFVGLRSNIEIHAMERAIGLVIEHYRAYRTYATGDSTEPAPGAFFDEAILVALSDSASDADVREAIQVVASVMRGDAASCKENARDAARRFNQLTAPIAAKAVEDTALYRYGRLLSRNDVGFSPDRFASTPGEFHACNARQLVSFPSTLLATATHDQKRGEDVRARLAVLSEIPDEWASVVSEWFALNQPHRVPAISPGDEYQLYQTLVGAWPFNLTSNDSSLDQFTDRIVAWRIKSLREEKLDTSWEHENDAVERAHCEFVRRILEPGGPFVERLAEFCARIRSAGALNGLVACLLRCAAPGVPDLYQGAELWDLSLVDPDNRRAVDFAAREGVLAASSDSTKPLDEWQSGAMKLSLIRRILTLRSTAPQIFAAGAYVPIQTSSERLLCFARVYEARVLLVAVPRLCARDAMASGGPLPAPSFATARDLVLPAEWRGRSWRDVLSDDGAIVSLEGADPLFTHFPAGVFLSEE
jgi:(1->4)-alpha-D-glucan 1-alpha-D-glucosylmutase